MGVSSLPKTVARQRRDCDLKPGPSTTRLPSQSTELKNKPTNKREARLTAVWGFKNHQLFLSTVSKRSVHGLTVT